MKPVDGQTNREKTMKLSIIGCGNVAKTMAYLWHANHIEIMDVVNRSQRSADRSVNFIGAGRALDSIHNLRAADVYVLGCNDDQIDSCLNQLLENNTIKTGTIIFHFSGAKSSLALNKAREQGALCASVHPVKSFAEPSKAIKTFAGTYCGIEGDAEALKVLTKLIEIVEGNSFTVSTENKLIYHAGSVIACNYLVALQEISLQAFEKSGVPRNLALKILEPLVTGTTKNIFATDTARALTGPIARGDVQLVKEQHIAVQDWNEEIADIYRQMGNVCLPLTNHPTETKQQIADALSKSMSE